MQNELAKDSIPQSVAAFLTYKRYLQHLELALTKTYGTEPALGRGVGEAVDSLPAVRRIRRRPLELKLRNAVARELGMAWIEEMSIRVLSEIDPTKLPSHQAATTFRCSRPPAATPPRPRPRYGT
jgi:hypothetical protein